jgi:predicted ATPase
MEINEDYKLNKAKGHYQCQPLVKRIEQLEEWIAAIADDHPQIPDWIQQSARSLLVQGAEELYEEE